MKQLGMPITYTRTKLDSEHKDLTTIIKRFLNYPNNWDGEGAQRLSNLTVETTLTQLDKFVNKCHELKIFPSIEVFAGQVDDIEFTCHLNNKFLGVTCKGSRVQVIISHIRGTNALALTIEQAADYLAG